MRNLVETTYDLIPADTMSNVIVSKNGKTGEKLLKLTRIKARSILFIEVDKVARVNTFRKFNRKDVDKFGMDINNVLTFIIKDGVMPEKWESSWDSIGSFSPSVQSNFGTRHYSNHSKGWASNAPQYKNLQIKTPMGAGMDNMACRVSNTNSSNLRSTTNSPVGFPMV